MVANKCLMLLSGLVLLENFSFPVALGRVLFWVWVHFLLKDVQCGLCLCGRVISNIGSLNRNGIGFNDCKIWRSCRPIRYSASNYWCLDTTCYMNAFEYYFYSLVILFMCQGTLLVHFSRVDTKNMTINNFGPILRVYPKPMTCWKGYWSSCVMVKHQELAQIYNL